MTITSYRGVKFRILEDMSAWLKGHVSHTNSKLDKLLQQLEPMTLVDPTLEGWRRMNSVKLQAGMYTIAYKDRKRVYVGEATFDGVHWEGLPKTNRKYNIWVYDGVINL